MSKCAREIGTRGEDLQIADARLPYALVNCFRLPPGPRRGRGGGGVLLSQGGGVGSGEWVGSRPRASPPQKTENRSPRVYYSVLLSLGSASPCQFLIVPPGGTGSQSIYISH